MPKAVEELKDKLLSDPKFYEDKSPEEQKSIAWAIAYKQYNQKKKKTKKKTKKKADSQSIKNVFSILNYSKKLESNNNFIESDALVNFALDFINDHSYNTK